VCSSLEEPGLLGGPTQILRLHRLCIGPKREQDSFGQRELARLEQQLLERLLGGMNPGIPEAQQNAGLTGNSDTVGRRL
jgi:hypothetical protein